MKPLITPQEALLIGLIFTRVIAIFLSFPLLNTSMIPTNIKLLLVVMLSFYISNFVKVDINIKEISEYFIALLILKELFIGFSLGLLVNIFVSALSYAAEIISYFMGLTVVNVFDPTFGQISVLNRFFILLFYMLFFLTDAYHYILGSIILSFDYIPLDKFIINEGVWEFIIKYSANIFMIGFQVAFPFALILFLINVALALVNRLIPQINVFIVGLPMQIFVGLASLAFGASVLIYTIITIIQRLGEDYVDLVKFIGF